MTSTVRQRFREELRDDIESAKHAGPTDILRWGLEILLGLGLMFRAAVHITAYLIANPDGEPTLGTISALDPIEAKRPNWNAWTARLSCCFIGLWLWQVGAELAGINANASLALIAIAGANLGVLIGDPATGVAEWILED